MFKRRIACERITNAHDHSNCCVIHAKQFKIDQGDFLSYIYIDIDASKRRLFRNVTLPLMECVERKRLTISRRFCLGLPNGAREHLYGMRLPWARSVRCGLFRVAHVATGGPWRVGRAFRPATSDGDDRVRFERVADICRDQSLIFRQVASYDTIRRFEISDKNSMVKEVV